MPVVLAVSAGAVIVYTACIGFHVGGDRTTLLVDDVGSLAALGLAMVATLWRARATAERGDRVGWLLLGISLVLIAMGASERAFHEIVLGTQTPDISFGSFAFVLSGPIQIAAVLFLCGRGLGGLRARLVLDGGLVASGLLLISWLTVLRAAYEAGGSPITVAVALSVPGTAVVAVVIGVATLAHSRRLDLAQMLVVSGLLLSACGEGVFAYLITAGQYLGAQLVDAAWFAGYLLFAASTLAERRRAVGEAPSTARWQVVLPYVPLAGAACLAIGEVLAHQRLDAFTVLVIAAMVILVLARQLMAVTETRALAARLHAMVGVLAETAQRWKEASTEREILIESAPVGICRLSAEGRLLSANRALQQILRRERDDMVGHSLREFLDPEGRAVLDAFDGRMEQLAGEARFVRGDSTDAWCSIATVAVPGTADGVESFISIVEDVNERRLEAERAAAIQRQLLPQGTPTLTGYELVGTCLPAQNVAGDFYDWLVADGHLDVTVADVMGKGMGAALVMAALRTALRAAPAELGPARRMTVAAETMALGLDGLFVTAFQARLDLGTGVLRYVDAGHGYCALRLASGELVSLGTRSLPLGVEMDATFSEGEVRMDPGDSILMYSDGLVETEAGTEEPEDLIQELRGAEDAAELLDRLMRRVPARLADDVTVVILRRLPAATTAKPALAEPEANRRLALSRA
jgi:PAS domain S-box-containing protein